MLMERNLELEYSNESMDRSMREHLRIIAFMARENIHEPMVELMLESEWKIKCMEKEYSNGLMGGNIKGSIMRIRNKVRGFLNGRMGGNIMECG